MNVLAGTGQLGRLLGFGPESGVRIGGLLIGNANSLVSGSVNPGKSSFNGLLVLDLNLDMERVAGIPGATVGAAFLRFDGQPSNRQAGSVTGYNGLTGQPPLDRSELYQLWWRQTFFGDRLITRVGKTVPTYDFNNVTRALPVRPPNLQVPSVSGLIYTPMFVNPTILGVLPGYYNSAFGVTTTLAPTDRFYASYGFYDGSLATGVQTGLRGTPSFQGYYLHIGEAGIAWLLGSDQLPGQFAAGAWKQTGRLSLPDAGVSQSGTEGAYVFGSQWLWGDRTIGKTRGVVGFFQAGLNNSRTMPANRYLGLGITGFGLIPGRPADSIGAGAAWSRLNENLGFHDREVMLSTYYQAGIADGVSLQPVVSVLPVPGIKAARAPAVVLTIQTTILF